ncbi:MAG: LysM peptidoglycan-binding domain-containing protein [Phycisphaerae bacterium]|nr:LysM peptidoglycan-binding domain-containing protein [Phycisphaerae bacterium]
MKFWQVGIISVAIVTLNACKKPQEHVAARDEEPYQPLVQMDTPPPEESDPYATDPMVTPPETRAAAEPVEATPVPSEATPPAEEVAGPRTHVVVKGDTLFKLARAYYNDQSKWKDIWQANRTRVPDPNKLEVGTNLIIP